MLLLFKKVIIISISPCAKTHCQLNIYADNGVNIQLYIPLVFGLWTSALFLEPQNYVVIKTSSLQAQRFQFFKVYKKCLHDNIILWGSNNNKSPPNFIKSQQKLISTIL